MSVDVEEAHRLARKMAHEETTKMYPVEYMEHPIVRTIRAEFEYRIYRSYVEPPRCLCIRGCPHNYF